MKNIWEKIKAFFSRIWQGLTWAGRIIIGIILIVLIALAIYALTKDKDNDSNRENKDPEVAQVYEPSIGSPLPATTTPSDNSGTVAGVSSTTPATTTQPTTDAKPTNMMVAPAAGVDPTNPIAYENKTLHFAATLPPRSSVDESKANKVAFTTESGKLLYVMSAAPAGTETLQTLQSQLSNSPSASNIKSITFDGQSALFFEAKEYGQGVVFISHGKIYYLLGSDKYFTEFKIM